jgi:hypothetical protein
MNIFLLWREGYNVSVSGVLEYLLKYLCMGKSLPSATYTSGHNILKSWEYTWGSHGSGYEKSCLLGYKAKSTDISEEHVASIFRAQE